MNLFIKQRLKALHALLELMEIRLMEDDGFKKDLARQHKIAELREDLKIAENYMEMVANRPSLDNEKYFRSAMNDIEQRINGLK